jgi:hypothetical protein
MFCLFNYHRTPYVAYELARGVPLRGFPTSKRWQDDSQLMLKPIFSLPHRGGQQAGLHISKRPTVLPDDHQTFLRHDLITILE